MEAVVHWFSHACLIIYAACMVALGSIGAVLLVIFEFYSGAIRVFIKHDDLELFIYALMFFTAINRMVFFPCIFNFLIEPRIEKKLGKKLRYPPAMYDAMLFGHFTGRYAKIRTYIVMKYCGIPWRERWLNASGNPLQRARYDITRCSRFEIVMSFIDSINIIILCLSSIAAIIITWDKQTFHFPHWMTSLWAN